MKKITIKSSTKVLFFGDKLSKYPHIGWNTGESVLKSLSKVQLGELHTKGWCTGEDEIKLYVVAKILPNWLRAQIQDQHVPTEALLKVLRGEA
jgi:hypothetical protein